MRVFAICSVSMLIALSALSCGGESAQCVDGSPAPDGFDESRCTFGDYRNEHYECCTTEEERERDLEDARDGVERYNERHQNAFINRINCDNKNDAEHICRDVIGPKEPCVWVLARGRSGEVKRYEEADSGPPTQACDCDYTEDDLEGFECD